MSKLVLDPCCGARMFWYDKQDDRVTFCDIRFEEHELKDSGKLRHLEVKPDVVADFTKLPFENDTFYHIVFDPPHMTSLGKNSWMARKYGRLTNTWRDDIKDGFLECFRVLKPGGTLIFKWNEYDIPVREVLSLTDEKPLYGHRSGKQQKTHWIAFIKPPTLITRKEHK